MGPSRRPTHSGGTNKWLTWTLWALYSSSVTSAAEQYAAQDARQRAAVSSSKQAYAQQAGSSPAEIPLLNHDVPTPKFRNTDNEVERYQALAPVSQQPTVRAPSTPQDNEGSESLSQLHQARLLSEWEADDIILLSTVDGALHARDRRTGGKRWTLELDDGPMIQTIHYTQNRSNSEDLLVQDDYIFIVEPSSEGQLFTQFADPRQGLIKLNASVRKMATETPFQMKLNDQWLATTSSQETKAYTIDAQTGEILHEFPRSKSSLKNDIQPRCRPRSGLEFEDPACKPGRTIRLGRNTYVFSISNEESDGDLCKITFSEWVTNKQDHDLQGQYATSLDEYDIKAFWNGRVMGIDTTREHGRQVTYQYRVDSPVARVFDVARKVNTDDDSTELVLLSRSAEYVSSQLDSLLALNTENNQKVFVNRTGPGNWYAMSEASYPGVTAQAPIAAVEQYKQDYFGEPLLPLDLTGDLHEIVGVHVLASGGSMGRQQTLTLPASANNPAEELTLPASNTENHPVPTEKTPAITTRLGDAFWGAVFVVLLFCLRVAWTRLSGKGKGVSIELPASTPSFELAGESAPAVQIDAVLEEEKVKLEPIITSVTVPNVANTNQTTPAHSRVQSVASSGSSPKKSRPADLDDAEPDSDDEGLNTVESNETEQTEEASKPRKKTKRGVRGGRGRNKKGDATTFEPKPVISTEKHLKDGMVQVGRLTYDSKLENCLGQGSSGTTVFPGTFDGRVVAVKRLIKTANSLAEKEIRHLVSSDEHPNVIRYHGKEESPAFFFIALDKFETSLDQFVEYPEKFEKMVHPIRGYDIKDALRQVTRGVQHLHSLKLVHRDIKPQNILVRPVRTNRPPSEGQLTPLLFVISDFGLCKPLEDGPESVFAATRTAAGTTGWKAPELLVSSRDAIAAPAASDSGHSHSQSFSKSTNNSGDGTVIDPPTGRRATKAIDVFSLGCVFFYVMTRGGHPFDRGGSPLARDLNVKEDKYDTSLLRGSFIGYDFDAEDLIMQMIMHDPKSRPDAAGILQHPFFWKVEHKLDFLCAVSDAYEERKQKITNIHDENAPRTELEKEYLAELTALQSLAVNVLGFKSNGQPQDWLSALPKTFLNEMGKQRKYTGNKMIDLLRVIRNKKNHFHDLPTDIKELMIRGPTGNENRGQIEGYYLFWRDKFPSLLVNCHQLVQERGLIEDFGLERYYNGTLF